MIAALLVAALALPGVRVPVDAVAAVVERRVITVSEVDAEARLVLLARATPLSGTPDLPTGPLDAKLKTAVLDTMVAHELLALEARRKGVVVREAEVDLAVSAERARFASAEVARAFFARFGIDEELLRGRARRDLLASAQLTSGLADLKVSDEEARAYLEIDIALAEGRPLPERMAAARSALLAARREERTEQIVADIARGVEVRVVADALGAAAP